MLIIIINAKLGVNENRAAAEKTGCNAQKYASIANAVNVKI